ncbi:hypothetical protein C7418_5285 [Cupriavidus plantarum]|nr:hypothetical protein C7418_5285 [Cupriavidus plantarum]
MDFRNALAYHVPRVYLRRQTRGACVFRRHTYRAGSLSMHSGERQMATQRPVGRGQSQQQAQQPQRSAANRPAEIDLAADSMWHTRGLQSNTRMRAPLARRTPPRQLPPSRLPRLLLWAVLLAVAGMLANAAMHMLR